MIYYSIRDGPIIRTDYKKKVPKIVPKHPSGGIIVQYLFLDFLQL